MEMTGERRIPAPRQRVWEALNDPEVLRASIPGCETIEKTGDDSFAARVAVKIGPMAAKFTGKVRLENLDPPNSYTIVGEGQGGAMGFAKGSADVSLRELGPSETLLSYAVKAQVGGKMAQLGARLIDSTAKQMADQFFDRFARQLTPAEAVVVAAAPAEAMAVAAAAPPGPLPPPAAPPAAGPAPGPLPPAEPFDLRPLRLFFAMEPFGLPMQFWIGAVLMLIILILLFVVG
ncbi:CoxG family protein [Caldovatus aquaticus]|uniref:Carbon monoxide dehydrogenase subunit G n=1 Tax=Caldovatus aquaticus TaxID=2865671 RepID=A0ABS7EYS5_9PROT|nr:carbon monoxide dehydrogenase subunit G [Caldovatus aquaticus]MBW8268520.1 carbon monoxide dehydrogenase subunit G [Caldovatus aquaticus]